MDFLFSNTAFSEITLYESLNQQPMKNNILHIPHSSRSILFKEGGGKPANEKFKNDHNEKKVVHELVKIIPINFQKSYFQKLEKWKVKL